MWARWIVLWVAVSAQNRSLKFPGLPDTSVDICARAAELSFTIRGATSLTRCESDGTCRNLVWTGADRKDFILIKPGTIPGPKRMSVSCMDAAGIVLDGSSVSQQVITRSDPLLLEIPLHYNGEPHDTRPRISIGFSNQNTDASFSLLLDTGSNNFHVEADMGRSAPWVRYADQGGFDLTASSGRCLVYGLGERLCEVVELKKIREKVVIKTSSGPISYSADLGLTKPMSNRFLQAGLMGAARGSSFARAVKLFAYLPPRVVGRDRMHAGRLLVGDWKWEQFCKHGSPLVTLNVMREWANWVLTGSVRINQGPEVYTVWVLDTAANGLTLPYESFTRLVRDIEKTGSQVERGKSGQWLKIKNCKDFQTRFPTIAVDVFDNMRAFGLTFEPREYIVPAIRDECFLSITHNGESGTAQQHTDLGTKFIEKLFTVFNSIDGTVGLCHKP